MSIKIHTIKTNLKLGQLAQQTNIKLGELAKASNEVILQKRILQITELIETKIKEHLSSSTKILDKIEIPCKSLAIEDNEFGHDHKVARPLEVALKQWATGQDLKFELKRYCNCHYSENTCSCSDFCLQFTW